VFRSKQRTGLGFGLLTSAWLLAANGPAVCVSSSNDPPVDAAASDAGDASYVPPNVGTTSDARVASDASHAEAPELPTGYLWYVGVQVSAFTRTQTAASSDKGPAVTVAPNWPVANFQDFVFDLMGNLWTIPISGDKVLRFPAAQLILGAMPAPDLILSSAGLKSPTGIALDASGNLWVSNYAGAGISMATIVRFDAVLGRTGATDLTPSLTIGAGADSASQTHFAQGLTVALSPSGKLWFSAAHNILCLGDMSGMNGQVTATPQAVLTTGDLYSSIAFSPTGALWVSAAKAGYFILRFDHPDMLTGNVTQESARVALPPSDASFVGGLGFEASGALWVSTNKQVYQFTGADALMSNVMPIPAVELGVGISVPASTSKLLFR
jgi:streptogramin lyase